MRIAAPSSTTRLADVGRRIRVVLRCTVCGAAVRPDSETAEPCGHGAAVFDTGD